METGHFKYPGKEKSCKRGKQSQHSTWLFNENSQKEIIYIKIWLCIWYLLTLNVYNKFIYKTYVHKTN